MVTYKESGVDIDSGNVLINKLKKLCPDIGGFGGLYPHGDDYLVAGTDGVGTKLKVAFEMNKHQTIGQDLVAMCVNDVITTGAKPLFFLDYYATGKLQPEKAERVLGGIVEGCYTAGCVLLGGETAEMPGFYNNGEYDLAGFCVGSVEQKKLIDGSKISEGDYIVGIRSSGFHSNGFSLIRKVIEDNELPYATSIEGIGSLGEALLTPTRIYVKEILALIKKYHVKGMAHITGGGLVENIPRVLPQGISAELQKGSWPISRLFLWLQKLGKISDEEMYRTFNMGIGYTLILEKDEAEQLCNEQDEYFIIGQTKTGGEISWK